MRRSLGLLLVLAPAALSACDSGSSETAINSAPAIAARGASSFGPRLMARPSEVAHAGVRRVEVRDPEGGPAPALVYREDVLSDGAGRFSLRPIEALTPVHPGWMLVQRGREGFFFRYRDFEIRDTTLFRKNYLLTDLASMETVTGRPCARYRIERLAGEGHRYELWVDTITGLPLRTEEFDDAGGLLSRVEYESFESDPDTSGAIWFVPSNRERVLDPSQDLEGELGVAPPMPRLLPRGFALRETATVADGAGTRWLKLTYLDGVEPLFFLVELPGTVRQGMAGGIEYEATRLPDPSMGADTVTVFEIGAARAAQGAIGGWRYVAVGKVGEDDLLDLIESSLP